MQLSRSSRTFAIDVTKIFSGSSVNQLLALLSSPLLTRLFSPSDFGVLAIYSALVSIISIFGSLRLETAIPLPVSSVEARLLVAACFGVLVLVTLITLALAVTPELLGEQVLARYDLPDFADYLWLVPVGVLMVGSYQIASYWALRERNYSGISRTRLYQGIVGTATKVLGGFMISGPMALVVGNVLAQSTGVLHLTKSIPFGGMGLSKRNFLRAAALVRRYHRFPLYAAPQSFLQTVGQQLPVMMLGPFFGIQTAGYYLLARQVLFNPVSVFGDAIRQVLYSEAIQARKESRLNRLFWRSTLGLALVGLAPTIVIMLAGPGLFGFVFGDAWTEAGSYARYLIGWVFFWLVSRPVAVVVPVLNLQKLHLSLESISFSARVATIVLGVLYLDAFSAVAALSVVGVLFYIVLIATVAFRLHSAMTQSEIKSTK